MRNRTYGEQLSFAVEAHAHVVPNGCVLWFALSHHTVFVEGHVEVLSETVKRIESIGFSDQKFFGGKTRKDT